MDDPDLKSPDAAGRARESPGSRVLYIEDKPENLMLVRRILARRPGVELVAASLGEQGLEEARSRPPELILLDLELPDIPGQEVLKRLRDDPTTRDVPVVVVSAEAAPELVERLLADGAEAYFTMPYTVSDFLATVDRLLGTGDSGPRAADGD